MTTSWVNCPVCGDPDMESSTDDDGNTLINCVNHACGSNGGSNFDAVVERINCVADSRREVAPASIPDDIKKMEGTWIYWRYSGEINKPINHSFICRVVENGRIFHLSNGPLSIGDSYPVLFSEINLLP